MKFINSLLILGVTLTVSCGGGSDDSPLPDPDPVKNPSASTLVFPEEDKECTQGTIKSTEESDVTFEWNTSQNTDSYEVNLKNLDSGLTTKTTSNTNNATITILRGTPYQWYVVSKATGASKTASSSIWKFYNEGPGIINYAPFPAEAVHPARGSHVENTATATISLEWSGSDIDDDIAKFTVFFDSENPPVNSLGTTTSSTIDATISNGTTYYWRVITEDLQENTSSSEVFQFIVK